jgi:hypothetical protein
MMFTESIERSDVVVVAVMFLIAFVLSLLAFYARMPFLLYLAATLFAFCWVGKENVHKAFRLIPIVLCLIITVMSMHQSSIYGMNYYYYDFVAAISAMISVFLLVSMIPDVRKQRRAKG